LIKKEVVLLTLKSFYGIFIIKIKFITLTIWQCIKIILISCINIKCASI